MGTKIPHSYTTHLLLIFLHLSSPAKCLDQTFDQSLDATFQDRAFKAMIEHHRPRTGALYNATIPKDLSGMKVSVMRLRTRTLYKKGVNFSHFVIPPGTRPVARVKRVLIVYHDLGNWSSLYYNISGYAFMSPVVGFLVYDASNFSSRGNLSALGPLNNTWGKPVRVEFHNLTIVQNQTRFCALFGISGKMVLTEMGSQEDVCYGKDEGHFSVVVPVERPGKRDGSFWVMGFVAGLIGLVAVGLAATVAVGTFFTKRNREVGKEADDEGECLQMNWIGESKMARAKVTRTQPVLEGTTPPSPRLSWYG